MARTGKIARLPYQTRSLLNQKLRNGESGVALVGWLNSLPEVKNVMEAEFEARPINEQNLTEWKKGGYEEWLRHEETRDFVREMADRSEELTADARDFSVADRLSAQLGVELARCLQETISGTLEPQKRLLNVLEISRAVSNLRRYDQSHRIAILLRQREEVEQIQKDEGNFLGDLIGKIRQESRLPCFSEEHKPDK